MEGFSETLLKEKTALVIGGTSGIGRSVVETFSSCGANVVVVGRSKSGYSKISFRPGSSNIFVQIDLHESTVSQYFQEHPEVLPPNKFDVIVASAGNEFIRPFHASSQSDFDESAKTTLEVAIDVACNLSKRKFLNDFSSIVFISSTSVGHGIPGMGIYAASRSGISSISKVLASELYTRNIRVNTVLAGATQTPMHDKIVSRLSKSSLNKYLSSHPLGFGDPQDIANMIVLLASHLGKWITGTSLFVDGGYSGIRVG